MQVSVQSNELVIRIPVGVVDVSIVQDFLDYLRFKSIVSKSEATDEEIDSIANEINQSWLEKNRQLFTNEDNHW